MAMGSNDGDMMSEINVTPLVDVMLVLLVVFIITAPLLAPQSLKINLPKTDSVQSNEKPQKLSLVVDAGQHRDGPHARERRRPGRDLAPARRRPAVPAADRGGQRGELRPRRTTDGHRAEGRGRQIVVHDVVEMMHWAGWRVTISMHNGLPVKEEGLQQQRQTPYASKPHLPN